MTMSRKDIFNHRDDWQRDAFADIKNRLISTKKQFLHLPWDGRRTQEEHYVMVYGKSQVGKTTLILTMIGIREGEDFQEVHDVLRAGIPRGNSSTSTAIVYSRSEDDRYGCTMTTADNLSPRTVKSYDRKGMEQRLKEIRQEVESGRASADDVLYITLPKRCFTDSAAKERISILDMPGIESKNHREDAHVGRLMMRYLPIVSVCIIAWPANEIQALEKMELPTGQDWRLMSHRFVLTITRAYSQDSVKDSYFFQQNRQSRKEGFYQHVTGLYRNEIKGILGEGNQTEIYPVDVGNSMKELLSELTSEEDRQELRRTRDAVLSDLQKSIVGHEGNRLKAAVDDLRDVAEHVWENRIERISDKKKTLEEKIQNAQVENDSLERKVQQGRSDALEEMQDLREELKKNHEAQEQLKHYSPVTGLYRTLEAIFSEAGLAQSDDKTYWKDKDNNAPDLLCTLAEQEAVRIVASLEPWADISSVKGSEIKKQCMVIWAENIPAPQSLWSMLSPKRNWVYAKPLETICQSVEKVINEKLEAAIQPRIQELEQEDRRTRQTLQAIESYHKNQDSKIHQNNEKIKELKKACQECETERKQLEKSRARDQAALDEYLKVARDSYDKQRREIMQKINSRLSSRGDKLLWILLLDILRRDYQKVTEGIYEDR